MRMYDIIAKKRDGGALGDAEIAFVVDGTTAGTIPDYQMAALLMAIYLRGMDAHETAVLTGAMARSGDVVDLSGITGVKADKHSTGGVGDKTTLVCAPLAAACGLKIAKMSGRGLGHTGGTVDKLEAIPGFRTEMDRAAFIEQVNTVGIALVGQSGNLAPADKKIYALRDVTATVGCIPLIASSIMSKKLAAGADVILLDVKTGTGALVKGRDEALALARTMVAIGEANGRRTAALLTDMDRPLGFAVGNSLEVAEAVQTLKGQGPADLTEVCLALTAGMLQLANGGARAEAQAQAERALADGSGFAKFREMVAAQGGDVRVIDDVGLLPKAALCREVCAPKAGYVAAMDTEKVGLASVVLGAGRQTKEERIDPAAGIVLRAKTGDAVLAGQVLAELHSERSGALDEAEALFMSGVRVADTAPEAVPLVQGWVGRGATQQPLR
ncbi:MAG: thymidine phosphorylase [Oscillospiraceae bacterium]